jgi:hypothetical protein
MQVERTTLYEYVIGHWQRWELFGYSTVIRVRLSEVADYLSRAATPGHFGSRKSRTKAWHPGMAHVMLKLVLEECRQCLSTVDWSQYEQHLKVRSLIRDFLPFDQLSDLDLDKSIRM